MSRFVEEWERGAVGSRCRRVLDSRGSEDEWEWERDGHDGQSKEVGIDGR